MFATGSSVEAIDSLVLFKYEAVQHAVQRADARPDHPRDQRISCHMVRRERGDVKDTRKRYYL